MRSFVPVTHDIPFDPIVTLLVFLISVPALVLQSMHSDVRQVLFERARWRRRLLWLIAIPFIISFVSLMIGGYVEFHFDLSHGNHTALWILVFSFVIIALFFLAIYFPLKYSRRGDILKLLGENTIRQFKLNGRIQEENIEDILDLGKNAESNQEKNIMLQVTHNIVLKICRHPSYTGDSFETLILRLHEVVMVDSRSASLENFRIVAEIFQEIAIARRDIPHVADLQLTVKATGNLGRSALINLDIGLEADNVIMSLIQTLGLINYIKPLDVVSRQQTTVMTEVSEALFDIGSLAAECGRDFISVAALDKMVIMLRPMPAADDVPKYIVDELTSDIIGLMAHIWSKGEGQQEFVKRRLPEVRTSLRLTDYKTLKQARAHYLEKSQFNTVNCIDTMARELKRKPHRKKK